MWKAGKIEGRPSDPTDVHKEWILTVYYVDSESSAVHVTEGLIDPESSSSILDKMCADAAELDLPTYDFSSECS